ncbi:nitrilase-related carbon-nitrogen hydrolase [Kineococcus rubinsiae]|uniref:nitrilase-related carbon-nitrogen hydrolase n=1 Tax=Kineococcus rubinsiae TaxID=2609562 RepID=UPI0014318B17|nr:nitrilase-related carbon-nitrogen hydrolase [Kineococcus rubinsiae]NIZ92143.1 hydrolase [Kineococcus rubinsiae]
MTRVVCAQLAPRLLDLDANRAASTAAVEVAVAGGADVVVLPELVTSGYVFASPEEAATVAITAAHPVFADWATAVGSSGAVVVGGFCERGEDGRLHNSAAVVDATGVLAVYRKVHLWDREKLVFTAGTAVPPVVETVHGRIAVIVCYDLEFPEWTRTAALAGADLIAVPTNWPLFPRPAGEHAAEVVIAMGTARLNRVAIACCDRSGVERGQEWTEGTAIVDADGWVVAAAGPGEASAAADLDLTRSRDKSYTSLADAFADRRPELYAGVVAP